VAGRQQSWVREGEYAEHPRGLRAGHVFTGVARELGRATDLLATFPDGDTGQAQVLACCRGFHHCTRPLGTPRTDGSRPGNGKRAPSEATREGQDGSLSGAEYRRRWGTQAHGTHWREGDAGHHVELARPPGETLRSPTVTPTLQRIAAQAARDPAWVFTTLALLIDENFVREAYRHTRQSSVPGIDGVTAAAYAEHLA
jgi:hypothetical protein